MIWERLKNPNIQWLCLLRILTGLMIHKIPMVHVLKHGQSFPGGKSCEGSNSLHCYQFVVGCVREVHTHELNIQSPFFWKQTLVYSLATTSLPLSVRGLSEIDQDPWFQRRAPYLVLDNHTPTTTPPTTIKVGKCLKFNPWRSYLWLLPEKKLLHFSRDARMVRYKPSAIKAFQATCVGSLPENEATSGNTEPCVGEANTWHLLHTWIQPCQNSSVTQAKIFPHY